MKWLSLIFISVGLSVGRASAQSFTPVDLVNLSSYSPRYAEQFLIKKKFVPDRRQVDYNSVMTTFVQNEKRTDTEKGGADSVIIRSIDIFQKNDSKYFVWRTTSEDEFIAGRTQLAGKDFFYDHSVDLDRDTTLLFQKGNITVETKHELNGDETVYSFVLKKKEYPDPRSIRFADDLLNFNSSEYLSGFFGASNLRQDLYYFSENDLRKCTVLFPNSNRQAVFVWKDQKNLKDLSCIIISDILPTVDGKHYEGALLGNNHWVLKNGIHCGMTLKELLMLNKNDFEIYGKRSEFAYMIKPEKNGELDFSASGVTLNCPGCDYNKLFDTPEVKAKDVAERRLSLNVAYISIFPGK